MLLDNYQMKKDIEAKYKSKDEVFTKRCDSIGREFQVEATSISIKAQI